MDQLNPKRKSVGGLGGDQLRLNFADLRPALSAHEAVQAADRCLFCFDAPCITACPTRIDIPLFIRQIASENTRGAARTILDANIFGGMCARACPTETLCEGACVRMTEGKPVEIGRLQRFATDEVVGRGDQLYSAGPASGRKVAVVGAGPAGLSCAHRLATLGHEVTVFEAREKPGGLNEYGIAAYKVTEDFAQTEVEYVLGVDGIDVVYGRRLGADFQLADLEHTFDAIFLGLGLEGVQSLRLVGEVAGVEAATDYIAQLRQADLMTMRVGKHVLVVGGGMTAIDAAIQSKRLGAQDVTIAYRRGPEQMRASDFERDLALTGGVVIRYWRQPKALVLDQGRLVGVELEHTVMTGGALQGTGSSENLPCDHLLVAIGQQLLMEEIRDRGIAFVAQRLRVDDQRRTSRPRVWAGGDCVAGGEDLTVVAVEDGKQAAMSMDRFLRAVEATTDVSKGGLRG